MARWLLLVCVVSLVIPATGFSRTWYIKPDGTGDARTTQAGIDLSAAGDTVLLADGTYTGTGNRDVNFRGKAITLRSESGIPELCIIDCQGSIADQHRGFMFTTGESDRTILYGISVRSGYSDDRGGAIYCDTYAGPKIENCDFESNYANNWGTAIYFRGYSSPILTDCRFSNSFGEAGTVYASRAVELTLSRCTFSDNRTKTYGGGICCAKWSSAQITDCSFLHNRSDCGGGIYADSASISIRDCLFSGNTAETGCGGAIDVLGYSPLVESCRFIGNSAHQGGAICFDERSSAVVSDCWIEGNSAQYGGGMYWVYSSPLVSRCVFIANSASNGGAIANCVHSSSSISNCTLSENSSTDGGVIYCWYNASATVSNTVICSSTVGRAVDCSEPAPANLTCCDIYGNAGGDWVGFIAGQLGVNGNFSGCPSFCNADEGDFCLCDESPCSPGNHPQGYDCGLIGASDIGCACGPTSTEPTTWGAIKSMYK